MWLDEAGEVVEMFRSSFPYSFLFFVPILILLGPVAVSPAAAAHEFDVFRMQHYDLQGSSYGKPIGSTANSLKCPLLLIMGKAHQSLNVNV